MPAPESLQVLPPTPAPAADSEVKKGSDPQPAVVHPELAKESITAASLPESRQSRDQLFSSPSETTDLYSGGAKTQPISDSRTDAYDAMIQEGRDELKAAMEARRAKDNHLMTSFVEDIPHESGMNPLRNLNRKVSNLLSTSDPEIVVDKKHLESFLANKARDLVAGHNIAPKHVDMAIKRLSERKKFGGLHPGRYTEAGKSLNQAIDLLGEFDQIYAKADKDGDGVLSVTDRQAFVR